MASGGEESSMMGDLLEYFEARSRSLDGESGENLALLAPVDSTSSSFVSLIKFNGVPILPPVLTQNRREEMQSYKRQALRQENKHQAKRREELHRKVQSIVAGVEERRAAKAVSKSVSSPSRPSSKSQPTIETVTKLSPGVASVSRVSTEVYTNIPPEIQIVVPSSVSSNTEVPVPTVSSSKSSGTTSRATTKGSVGSTSKMASASSSVSTPASSVSTLKSSAVFKSHGNLSKTKSFSTQHLDRSASTRLTADLSSAGSPSRKDSSLSPKSGLTPRPPEGRPSSRRSSALRQSYSFPDLRSIDFSVDSEELKKPINSRNLSPKGGRPQQSSDPKPKPTTEKAKKETKETKSTAKKTQNKPKTVKEAPVKEPSKSEQNRQLQNVLQKAGRQPDPVRPESNRSVSPVLTEAALSNPLEQLEREIAQADEQESSSKSKQPQPEVVEGLAARLENVRSEGAGGDTYLDPIQTAALDLLPPNITEEQALATLDSLKSDFASLDNQPDSLPRDYNGIPLTSVKQQHIIQMLTRLSKALNIEDTMTSTASSNASGEPGMDIAAAGSWSTQKTKENTEPESSQRQAPPVQPVARKDTNGASVRNNLSIDTNLNIEGSDGGEDSSNVTNNSHVTSASPNSSAGGTPASILSSGANTSASSAHSRARMSPTASILSSASSVSASRSRMSPKSLKNTVHFSSFVTEISTSASQSYEDKISVRKMDITPASSANFDENGVQGQSHDLDLQNIPGSGPKNLLSAGSSVGPSVPQQPDSLLSKVALSPDIDSSYSSPGEVKLRGCQFVSQDGELNTSDKENEFAAQSESSSEENYDQGSRNHDNRGGYYGNRNGQVLNCYTTNIPAIPSDPLMPIQALVKASMKSDASESSTLKGSQDPVLAQEMLDKLNSADDSSHPMYATDSTSLGKYMQVQGSAATYSSSGSMPEEISKSYTQQKQQQSVPNISMEKRDKPKSSKSGRKTQAMLEAPSPILLKPVVYSHAPKTARNKVSENIPPGLEKVQLEESSNEEEGEEEAEPDIPEPIKTGEVEEEEEQEGKAEHIQKYLNQVHEHSLQNEEEFQHATEQTDQKENFYEMLDTIGDTIQSFTSSIQSMNHLSHEELFKLQAEQFELLQQQLIHQQQAQLEELFVQQRREQMSLQTEIETYQHKISQDDQTLSSQEDVETIPLKDSYHPNVPQTQPPATQAWQNQAQYPAVSASEPVVGHTVKGRAHQTVKGHNHGHNPGNNPYPYISSPSLFINPKDRDNASEISSIPKTSPKQLVFSNQSTPVPAKVFKPVERSPVKRPYYQHQPARVTIPEKVFEPRMQPKFDRLSAAVKGYLTRRLLKTQKVQEIIKTIADTRNFAFSFQAETPIKKGTFSNQDRYLLERIVAQLQAALLDIHDIFFIIPMSERMALIAHTRQLDEERRVRESRSSRESMSMGHPRVSQATLKAMERKKKAQQAEEAVFGEFRPKSAPPATSSPHQSKDFDRALRPLQGQVSPIYPDSHISVKEVKERPRSALDKHKGISSASVKRKTTAGNKTSRPSTATSGRISARSKTTANTATKTVTKTAANTAVNTTAKTAVITARSKKQEKAWR